MTITSAVATRVLESVAAHLNTTVAELRSATRTDVLSTQRAVAAYALRQVGLSQSAIGEMLDRDPSTICVALERVEFRFAEVVGFREEVEAAVAVAKAVVALVSSPPPRRRLPDERNGVTIRFKVNGPDGKPVRGYCTINRYDDGTPGEMFFVVDKTGSTARGFVDADALASSMLLQSGTPIWAVVGRFVRGHDEAGSAGSVAATILDLAARAAVEKFSDGVVTHEFTIGDVRGYLLAGLGANGMPVEVRVAVDAVDASARDAAWLASDLVTSLLRLGVPLPVVADKYIGGRFEPSGWTSNEEIRNATSVLDYAFRFLYKRFYPREYEERFGEKVEVKS